MRNSIGYMATLCAIVLLLVPGASQADKTSIWFCPMDPSTQVGYKVSYAAGSGYMDLFTAKAPWQNAAKHVNVFKIYAQWLRVATDAQLQQEFADLKRRHIALALEDGLQTQTKSCGQGLEGYGGDSILRRVRRIRQNRGDLRYVQMDEPIFYGSIYDGRTACQRSIADTMADVANNCKTLWSEFPDVQVGDIEPIVGESAGTRPGLIERYREGIRLFRALTGRPLASFTADVSPQRPGAVDQLIALRKMLAEENVPFGIIYIGGGADTDHIWVNSVARNMAIAEGALGRPDIAIFQSWNPRPLRLLPDNDPDIFTSIINRYFGVRTKLSVSVANSVLTGRLMSTDNRPVSSSGVSVTLRYRSTIGKMATYTVNAHAPDSANGAVLAIRINTHDDVPGSAALGISSLTLKHADESVRFGFATPEEAGRWTWLDHADKTANAWAKARNSELDVVEQPTQTLALNSPEVPINADDACSLEVNAAIPYAAMKSGYFALVFMKDHHEVTRAIIPFAPPLIALGAVNTGRDGRFRLDLPSSGGPKATGVHIDAQYEGDLGHWPAFASVDR